MTEPARIPVAVVAATGTARIGLRAVLDPDVFDVVVEGSTVPDTADTVNDPSDAVDSTAGRAAVVVVHTSALSRVSDLDLFTVPVVAVTDRVDTWWLHQLADTDIAGLVADVDDLDELSRIVAKAATGAGPVTLYDTTVRDATANATWQRARRTRNRITPAQREIAELIAQGYQDQQIAAQLNKSVDTVKEQVGALYRTVLADRPEPANKRVLVARRLAAAGIIP